MEPALTPDLALVYLRELSADVRAGVLLDAHGERLAGPRALARAAAELRAAAAGAPEVELRDSEGWVFAAHSPAHFLLVVTAPFALPGLVRHDLRAVLRELEGDDAQTPHSASSVPEADAKPLPADLVRRVVTSAYRNAPD